MLSSRLKIGLKLTKFIWTIIHDTSRFPSPSTQAWKILNQSQVCRHLASRPFRSLAGRKAGRRRKRRRIILLVFYESQEQIKRFSPETRALLQGLNCKEFPRKPICYACQLQLGLSKLPLRQSIISSPYPGPASRRYENAANLQPRSLLATSPIKGRKRGGRKWGGKGRDR